jgi:hypothetical protein
MKERDTDAEQRMLKKLAQLGDPVITGERAVGKVPELAAPYKVEFSGNRAARRAQQAEYRRGKIT